MWLLRGLLAQRIGTVAIGLVGFGASGNRTPYLLLTNMMSSNDLATWIVCPVGSRKHVLPSWTDRRFRVFFCQRERQIHGASQLTSVPEFVFTVRRYATGISRMMIRLSGIMQPVYEEILSDIKLGTRIWADETGWRVKGELWWLWAFANERSAYYWAEKCRGSPVVERLLGRCFWVC